MKEELNRLLEITDGCREDMHEPDEQGLSARVLGIKLDNAFTPSDPSHELRVMLTRGEANHFVTDYFSLATLIALARKARLDDNADLLDRNIALDEMLGRLRKIVNEALIQDKEDN